ncbi:MAG: PAS domain-containing protein [Rhodospirillaceae bacterium]|nr:PAS domain-containing protein [Rhodospirillaceae bacterium]
MTAGPGFWDGDLPPDVQSEKVIALFRMWQDKRGTRTLPSRTDFDVAELKPWLGRLIIYDVLGDAEDFRYRLVGTDIVRIHGLDLTGRLVSEACYMGGTAHTRASLAEMCRSKMPRYRKDGEITARAWARAGERLFLPLGRNGDTVDQIICLAASEEELVPRYQRPGASTTSPGLG